MSYKREHGYIPMTIELWLQNYAEAENHIKRHETLWHEWNHNKQWLSHVQELILPSFPSYSQHGLSHSEAVIRNIEMLLGEGNIKSLSATDCFALLHTVYIHDIGMCITYTDRKEILKNEKFHDFLNGIRQGAHDDMARYAECLLQVCFDEPVHMNDKDRLDYILEQKLDIFYAVTYLFAEYRRIEHGDISRKRLEQWIGEPSKLGAGFSTMEIPNRIFYAIAECAEAHTKWDFDAILQLPAEDTGYVLDYIHPRFIAVLLQLGDALDMDNDRFHPLVKEYLGELPTLSEMHFGKHRAIRKLHITNRKISIKADCRSQDELRLVRLECDNIQNIIEKASYHWAVIRPKNSKVSLPTLDAVEIFLNGNLIPSKLIIARFEISQDKAFKLLQGHNFYKDGNFVFLRELLQNAVDATKIQYYHDYCRNIKYNDSGKECNPADVAKLVSPLNYPIEIELRIVRVEDGKYVDVLDKDLGKDNVAKNSVCGILVKVKDCGTGIRSKEIEQIVDVGSSYQRRKLEVRKMPKWLQPTGVFGIGLQSVFLASDKLKAITYTRNEECYEISFYPRSDGNEGYVNVMPLEKESHLIPYGTCFELFVNNEKRRSHTDSPETWNGTDPFISEYGKESDIRHARELIKQMALYLAEIIGEPLFPITLKIYDYSFRDKKEDLNYDETFINKFQNLSIEIYGHRLNKWERVFPEVGEDKQVRISWAYDIDKKDSYFDSGNAFWLNEDEAKLYIWNSHHNAYARLGVDRIIAMQERFRKSDDGDDVCEQMQVYYKGMLLSKVGFRNDANLIEYIDLKETMNSAYLKLNRNGLSIEGYRYLEKVYRDILDSARKALRHLGAKERNREEYPECIQSIKRNIKDTISRLKEGDGKELQQEVECAERYFLSVAALAYFAMVEKRDDFLPVLQDYDVESWNKLLQFLEEKLREMKEVYTDESDPRSYWRYSFLHNIPIWGNKAIIENSTIDIINFIQNKNKFAILSVREGSNKVWNEYLIELDSEAYKTEVLDNIIALRNEHTQNGRQKKMAQIYKFVEPTMKKNFSKTVELNLESERKSHLVLKWMLNNIPTIAMFASLDGKIRLNILDSEVTGSLYLDMNMKKLTMERMLETYEKYHIQRFSTLVWSGFHYLSLKTMPQSVKYIKRGKLSESGNDRMLFPLSGAEIKELFEDGDKMLDPIQLKLENLYDNVVRGVYYYVQKALEKLPNDDGALDARFWTLISQNFGSAQEKEKEKEKEEPFVFEDLEKEITEVELTKEEQQNLVNTLLPLPELDEKSLNALYKYQKACFALFRLFKYYNSVVLSQKQLEKYEASSAFENLVQYVAEHSALGLSKERVQMFYRTLIYGCMYSYLRGKKQIYLENYNKLLTDFFEQPESN